MGPVTLTYAAGLTSHENAGIERYYVTYLKSYEIIAETQPPDLMDLMDMRPDQAPEEDAALSETRMFATKIAHVIQFDSSIVARMSEIRDNNNDKQKTEEQAFLDVLPNTKKENGKYVISVRTDDSVMRHGLVFYDEIHQSKMITNCSHWPPQVFS